MQSGYPHSHGGAYPAFQHWSNVGAVSSLQDTGVTSVPVVHRSMIATHYPGEIRVAYSSAQWQQGNAQSQQNFQALHHQRGSQTSTASTGFQHPKHGDSAKLKAKADFVAEFRLQDQCSSVPVRTQQGSYPLLHALLGGNPPDFKSFFTTQSSSSKEMIDKIHCKSQQVKGSLAPLNCGQTGKHNLVHSGETYSTAHQQQVSSPLSGQPSTDKVSPIGEMVPPTDEEIQDVIAKTLAYYRTIHKSKVAGDCAESASEKHSTGTLVSAVGNSKHAPETVEECSDRLSFASKKTLGKFIYSDDYEDKTFVGSNDESFHSKWCDKYLENGKTILHYSLTTLKELIASLENVETSGKMDSLSHTVTKLEWGYR